MTVNPFDYEDFRKEFKATIADSIQPITAKLAEHDSALRVHQDAMTQGKTVIGTFAFIWSSLLVTFEWLIHRR